MAKGRDKKRAGKTRTAKATTTGKKRAPSKRGTLPNTRGTRG